MKVSVLTPIYKTDERFLRETIESVLAQTFSDFEFLLLDDCPEDDRAGVVGSYDDKRVLYVKNDRNLGITASRNRLIDMAKGEYLAVLDHDDVCRPERFAREVAYLDAHPGCGVVSGWTRLTSNGSVNTYPEDDHEIKYGMMSGPTLWHPASMIRKSVLDVCGVRYEEEYFPVEDYMLWMKLLPRTEFHNIQEVLLDYRWHAGNTSVKCKRRLIESDLRVRAWAKVHYPELYTEWEFRRESVKRVRLFGLPLLKITTGERETDVRLFDRVPFINVQRRFR
ncbi:MAG: glycosyltransferase family 2 protein [Kiritimatiellae bacterium]|nr:glycosyltransferase family 2 protein [Kiritimatiellia bacterium]